MNKNSYELNVLVNGKPVREYFHNNRFFIEAKNGTEYSLKLKNHSHKKIMAVISVDGVDVLKGQKGAEAESGYIVAPYSHINIVGYRIDDGAVATFKFSDGKTSYATQVEQKFDPIQLEKVEKGEIAPAQNNGVIGIRIWEEKETVLIPEWKNGGFNNKSSFYFKSYPSHGIYCYSGGSFTTGSFVISGCYTPMNVMASGYSGPQGPMGTRGLVGAAGSSLNFCSSTCS